MISGVADTHTALWYLLRNPRLSLAARTFIEDAARAGQAIGLSPISLAEIVYLVEKNRLPMSALEELKTALADPDCVITEAPFTAAVVDAMRRVPRSDIPDLPDRNDGNCYIPRGARYQPRRPNSLLDYQDHLVTL